MKLDMTYSGFIGGTSDQSYRPTLIPLKVLNGQVSTTILAHITNRVDFSRDMEVLWMLRWKRISLRFGVTVKRLCTYLYRMVLDGGTNRRLAFCGPPLISKSEGLVTKATNIVLYVDRDSQPLSSTLNCPLIRQCTQ